MAILEETLNPVEPPEELTLDSVEPYIPGQAQSSPTYTEPEVYRPATEDTVAGQMTGILASGSPYMESARKSGERVAHKRGLLNTSLAGEASQKAAIEAALPIAQQDSAAITSAGLSGQEFKQQAGLTDIQAAASSQLSKQEAGQEMGQLEFREAATTARHEAELEMNQMLQQMNLSSDEVRAIGSSVTLLGQSLSDQIALIQSDPNMAPNSKSKIINQLTKQYKANVESVARIYSVPITWN